MKNLFQNIQKRCVQTPYQINRGFLILLLSLGNIDGGGDDDDDDDGGGAGGGDGGGSDGGGFDEGQPVEYDINRSSYSTETNYVDDDLNLSDPNDASSAAYSAPINYEFPVHIVYQTFPLAIVELDVLDVIVRPNSQTTIHPTKGVFTRVLTPLTTAKSGYFIGPVAYCSWSWQLNIRYTNITEGFSYTRQISGSHSAVISVP